MTDQVNHPPHYTQHPSGVECIDVTEHMGFNLGNAVKYIWRADLKGSADTDLAKAAWYINREIERRCGTPPQPSKGVPVWQPMSSCPKDRDVLLWRVDGSSEYVVLLRYKSDAETFGDHNAPFYAGGARAWAEVSRPPFLSEMPREHP